MPRKTLIIPKAPLARLMEHAGAQRVGKDACVELSGFLIDYALAVAKKASEIAQHAGRKTVNAGDVKLAAK
ncbi:TPA: histone family protein [Candidatus Woesearchaeota archaeon]|nr:MAG: histone A [archaeon GW2011_AR11]HIH05082.1 histone family protein [Candidatus Woesearchaeota archaeon]HIH92225.1 histone family protein [Candidatus Woesearchaeota archaeon]HIJ18866.1 histone family protein [Candidatus Woesearchaeota archaeon]